MYKLFDASFLNVSGSISQLAPLCRKYGFDALNFPIELFEDKEKAMEATEIIRDNGLRWGLMPYPCDLYSPKLTDAEFDEMIKKLERWGEIASKIGIDRMYSFIWPSSPKPFDENFDWHVNRIGRVNKALRDNGVFYGLEYLGAHELRRDYQYEFVHSLAGILSLADTVGNGLGFVFDTYHWFCATNNCMDDLYLAAANTNRLTTLHLSDAVSGRAYNEQKNLDRRLPMSTGIRPKRSRAAMIEPSSFKIKIDAVPTITDCAKAIPSAKLLFWLMSAATSSVGLMRPPVMALKCPVVNEKYFSINSSALLIAPMIQMA